jgi:hypothetical protein
MLIGLPGRQLWRAGLSDGQGDRKRRAFVRLALHIDASPVTGDDPLTWPTQARPLDLFAGPTHAIESLDTLDNASTRNTKARIDHLDRNVLI